MAFADPVSLTLGATITPSGGTATSHARVRTDGYASEYRTSDNLYTFKITHNMGSRNRSEVRVDMNQTYTDPSTGLVIPVSASVYTVINRPNAGFTTAQIKAIIAELCAFMGSTTNEDKILAFES